MAAQACMRRSLHFVHQKKTAEDDRGVCMGIINIRVSIHTPRPRPVTFFLHSNLTRTVSHLESNRLRVIHFIPKFLGT
jgi:hypothetical protein